jgi:glycosyltransferase involved in cell wall biosynthesis
MNASDDSPFSRLSVSIIAGREEHNIRACLESVAFAGEIIVVCSEKTDATMTIAREFTEKVEYRPFEADERVSGELRENLRSVLAASGPTKQGYYIPRRNHFHGRWIRHGGWYPDHQLRLFLREKTRVTDRLVHEGFEVDGERGHLEGHLLHYTLPRVRHMLRKNLDYALFEAREKRNRRRITILDFALRPPIEFIKKYIFQRAVLDGWEGLIISVIHAANKLQMLTYLWEMQYRGTDGGDEGDRESGSTDGGSNARRTT